MSERQKAETVPMTMMIGVMVKAILLLKRSVGGDGCQGSKPSRPKFRHAARAQQPVGGADRQLTILNTMWVRSVPPPTGYGAPAPPSLLLAQ